MGKYCGASSSGSTKGVLSLDIDAEKSSLSISYFINGMERFHVPDMAFRVSAEGRIDLMSRDPDLMEAIPIESLMYDSAEDTIKATLTSGASYLLSKSKCDLPALEGSYKSFDGISSANLNMNANSVILCTPWHNEHL